MMFITEEENDFFENLRDIIATINDHMVKLLPHTLGIITHFEGVNPEMTRYTAIGMDMFASSVIIYDSTTFLDMIDKYLKYS